MTKVSIAIQSHLSDIQINVEDNQSKLVTLARLYFVRKLIRYYPDTNERVSDETLSSIWEEACEIYKCK